MAHTSSWSYADNDFGPHTWQNRYKVAKGNLQSPINIDTEAAEEDNTVEAIKFNYLPLKNSTITNDGRHLQITLPRNDSVLTGGPLTDTYQLVVIRFRWGHDNNSGSEHAINDQNYPLEVQLIHWNKSLYKNIGEAMGGENGLCIMGLLYQQVLDDDDNEGLMPIIKLLSREENKGCFSLEVKSTIDPTCFIKDMTSYWTYQGSLTTPPMSENVTWIISENILKISEKQLSAFRNVRNSSGELMAGHCRPLCPLNGRPLRFCAMNSKNNVEETQYNNTCNTLVDDCDDDKENEMVDENANYNCDDTRPDGTDKGYSEDIYKLEAIGDHVDL